MKEGGLWELEWQDSYTGNAEIRPYLPLAGRDRIEVLVVKKSYSSGSYCDNRGKSSLSGYGEYVADFQRRTLTDVDAGIVYHFIF